MFNAEETRQHLLSRGFDPDRYRYTYDEATGTIHINLYSADKRFIGYQEYRPHSQVKGGQDLENHGKRYYTDVSNKNDANSVMWGIENINADKDYLFITEGVFDAAPINQLGEPAIAALSSSLAGAKIQQLRFFGKKIIAILDNDKAGQSARLRGHNRGEVKHGDLRAVAEMLGGLAYVVPDPYNDFGEMYADDQLKAKAFLGEIVRRLVL